MVIEIDDPTYLKVIKYPAGELQVSLTAEGRRALSNMEDEVSVVARIHNADDIMLLVLLSDAIRGHKLPGARMILTMPYLPYGRADRRFSVGDCCGIDAFMRIVDGCGYDTVRTIDIHSERKDVVNIMPTVFIARAIISFAVSCGVDAVNVILPDQGSQARYSIPSKYECGSLLAVKTNIVTGRKIRDPKTGAIVYSEIGTPEGPSIIIDDICDGGATFISLASYLRSPLGLYVTHGIFSRGLDVLFREFVAVYCTDSYRNTYFGKRGCTVYKIAGLLV